MPGCHAREERTLSHSQATGERLAAVGILAAGLAHELNNPIGSILLAAQNAKATPSRADECLDTILRNARRCADVVRNVLMVSRSEPAAPEPLAVNAIVEQAVLGIADDAGERRAELTLHLDPSVPDVLANALEIEQAVENLLRNAIESAESGVRIDVATTSENGCVTIRISDDGRGVPQHERDRVFEPFFTTRQEEGGTGLGLSLVRAIVHSCGGTIDFASVEGDGTCVAMTLPAVSPQSGGV